MSSSSTAKRKAAVGPGNHLASVNSKYLPDSFLVWCIADDERMSVAKSKGTRRNLWSLFQLFVEGDGEQGESYEQKYLVT